MITLRLFEQRIALRFYPSALLCSALLMICLFSLFMANSLIGNYSLTLMDSLYTLFGQTHQVNDAQATLIVWEFRLPRALVAIFSGTLFALSGALLQSVTRNPLADPSLVGISQGAALAVVTLTLAFPNHIDAYREIAAFCGALGITLLIHLLSGKGHALKFILLGIGVAAFISAIISTLLTYGNLQSAMSALAWLAGSTHSSSWPDVALLASAALLCLLFAMAQARSITALSLGEEVAIGLGVNIHRAMLTQLILSVLAAAIATAVVGPLGFIGLLAPHISRKLVHCASANQLFITALIGAVLVLLADLIGRSLFSPAQLSAGLVTSLLGAPLFATLLIKHNRQ